MPARPNPELRTARNASPYRYPTRWRCECRLERVTETNLSDRLAEARSIGPETRRRDAGRAPDELPRRCGPWHLGLSALAVLPWAWVLVRIERLERAAFAKQR